MVYFFFFHAAKEGDKQQTSKNVLPYLTQLHVESATLTYFYVETGELLLFCPL